MSHYCLDTSAYTHFRSGDARVTGLVDGATSIGIPSVAVGELLLGFRLGRQTEKNETDLREFLTNPAVDILGVDSEAGSQYADISLDLRRNGTPIPTNDIWIAAVAARHGATVLTYDNHFSAVSRVGSVVLRP